MRRSVARIAVAFVVATLLVQGVGASVGTGLGAGVAPAGLASQEQPENETEAADEIYVEDDGDAVAVYESPPTATDVERTEFGLSTAENLAHLRMTDSVDDTPDVRGGFVIEATRTALATRGNLSMPTPEALQSFSFEASGESTNETSRADLTLSVTALDESGMTHAIRTANTSGEITMSADRLTATGNFSIDANVPIPANARQSLDARFREESGDYVLTVEQSSLANPQFRDVPRNASAARDALELQYGMIASSLNGSASIEVQSYDVTETGSGLRVDQAYTIRLEGIDDGLQQVVRTQLATNQQVTDEQADRLANALATVEVRDVHLQYAVTANGATGNVSVDVGNYGDLAMAYFDLVSAMDENASFGPEVERMEATFEAQQAADLEQTVTWSGSMSHPDGDSVHGEFEYHASASNWAAYVDELEARNVPSIETHYAVEGGIEDERLVFDGNASMADARLYQELLRSFPSEETASAEATQMLAAVRDSQPERAKLVTTYDEDGLLVEAGAGFGNLTALRDGLRETTDLPAVSDVVGHVNESGGSTYVTVEGAVDGEITESSVRSLSYVDEETTVYLPGEGERDFPSMDVERAETFLDFEVTTGASGPGFGAIAALVALLGVALLVARRD